MNDLFESCRQSDTFPQNLVCHDRHKYELDTYVRELGKREGTLFCAEGEGAVDFWDLKDKASRFQYTRLKDSVEVGEHLGIPGLPNTSDPVCRYVFFHGRKSSSREVLEVSRKMLSTIMTYHQMNPSFLDFLFSFGNQDHANPQDFHYSGFRHETRLTEAQRGPQIKSLKRSGRAFQLCYSLRSAERMSKTEWSIRALAVHQTFDFEAGHATWLILKGNEFTKKKLLTETESSEPHAPSHFYNVGSSFSSALSTHSILCNWAGENWRWYINDMEREVQKITQKTLSLEVLNPQSPPPLKSRFSRRDTGILVVNNVSEPASKPRRKFLLNGGTKAQVPESVNGENVKLTNMAPSNAPPDPLNDPLAGDFTFKDLQRIEEIEEQANEALLVLSLNTDVLSAIKEYFQDLVDSKVCPAELEQDGEERVGWFVDKIDAVRREIQIQKTRLQTLLRLLADRKTLLYGILDFRSIQASKNLAEKAQFSAEQVEFMTQQMHDLAEKTKKETVSMRIITLVTLFFLPGTFISTLMSTDIIHFQRTSSGAFQKVVSTGAINTFLAITLPLMVLTFLAWGAFYQWSKWQERKKSERKWADPEIGQLY